MIDFLRELRRKYLKGRENEKAIPFFAFYNFTLGRVLFLFLNFTHKKRLFLKKIIMEFRFLRD